jgi:hypothetical protein
MLLVTGFDGMGPAAGAGLLVLAGAGAVRSPSAASRFAPRLTQLVRSNLLF